MAASTGGAELTGRGPGREGLVVRGQQRIEWAADQMPVVEGIRREWEKSPAEGRPLRGVRIGACLHVTTETANLMRALVAGGAQVRLTASNPLSTQDDVAAALSEVYGVPTWARRGESADEYYQHIQQVLDFAPHITLDDGADLVTTLHEKRPDLIANVRGGAEETTTGVIRLRALAATGRLRYPMIAVNDADTKHLFDNRYGTGQSTIDGILRATNYLLAGSTFVVVGYGWCGRGVASRARGMGANVIVCEVNPVRALEAVMDGYRVMPLREAAPLGDLFVTVTGDLHVLDAEHIARLKDGAILANAGHFNVEINLEALAAQAVSQRLVRENVMEYRLADGRRIRVLAEGRLVNLAAAEGHPAAVMDMSFANQALVCAWLAQINPGQMQPGVYPVPESIDHEVARRKLAALGIQIDELRPEQVEYLRSFAQGT